MHPFLRLTCRLGRVFAAGMVVFALTGCTPSAKTYQPPSKPTTTTPTPTPTVVPSATLAARALTRDEQHAVNLAVDQYRGYTLAFDEMAYAGGSAETAQKVRKYVVPGGDADKEVLDTAASYRKRRIVGQGPTRICWIVVNSAPSASQLKLTFAVDLTGAYFTENGGPKQRASHPYTTAVATFTYTNGAWLISNFDGEVTDKC